MKKYYKVYSYNKIQEHKVFVDLRTKLLYSERITWKIELNTILRNISDP